MFKNRFFLYGLGLGLITASIILQLAHLSNQDELRADDIHWPSFFTKHFDDISDAAKEEGFMLVPSSQNSDFSSQHQEQPLTDDPSPQVSASDSDHDAGSNPIDSVSSNSDTEDSVRSYELTVIEGMTSIDVAALAEQIGLVDDRLQLEQSLASKGLSEVIQIGTFHFEEKPDIDELISAITK